jgi:hypothetical protein
MDKPHAYPFVLIRKSSDLRPQILSIATAHDLLVEGAAGSAFFYLLGIRALLLTATYGSGDREALFAMVRIRRTS